MQIPQPPIKSWQRIVQKLAATRPGSRLLARLLPTLDRSYTRLRNGKGSLTQALSGLPVVYLTSYGVVSGRPRICPLIAVPHGETLVLIASNFGSKRHPAWYYNLRRRPEAVISFNGQENHYYAREAEGDARSHYWELAVRRYAGYQAYAQRAGSRKIPVMVLEPAPLRTGPDGPFRSA